MITNKIIFQKAEIEFTVAGKGRAVVLLHGYMESLNVWDDFAEKLSQNYLVISIDLPGHGNSGVINEIHSMELMADVVDEVMSFLKIDKFTLIGHSMGGYVVMEYLSKYPEKLNSYCLFHSTPFADTEEKQNDRDRIIGLIKQGKKVQLAKNHVEKTFADENVEKFAQEIGFLKIIAVNTPDEGVISALKGMKFRKNHYQTMMDAKIPSLWILGKLDNFIPIDNVNQTKIPDNCEIFILEQSGHQGFIEQLEKSIDKIQKFLQ